MRLTELEPEFLKLIDEYSWQRMDSITDADGVFFLCPTCWIKNNGPVGTHAIICWTPKVPLNIEPGPGRWELLGTGYEDLTLRAGSSSVFLQSEGGCKAHFFIQSGNIRMC